MQVERSKLTDTIGTASRLAFFLFLVRDEDEVAVGVAEVQVALVGVVVD
jgi:hypothetical protein